MDCREMKKTNSKLADLLLDPESVSVEARRHVEECADCRRELAELRSTMSLMDAWSAPDLTPFFDSRLLARLRAEQQAPPAGFFERLKARLLYTNSLRMQPMMAGALAVAILLGGGTYADLAWRAAQTQESATVHDLQSLDGNAQVFQQLDSVDQSNGQQNPDSGVSTGSSSND